MQRRAHIRHKSNAQRVHLCSAKYQTPPGYSRGTLCMIPITKIPHLTPSPYLRLRYAPIRCYFRSISRASSPQGSCAGQSRPWISTNKPTADDGFFKSGSSSAGSLAGAGFFPLPMVGSRSERGVPQVRRSGKYRYGMLTFVPDTVT